MIQRKRSYVTYKAGQIKINPNRVLATRSSPNVNVSVHCWLVSREMYSVAENSRIPIIVVGTRDIGDPSLSVSEVKKAR